MVVMYYWSDKQGRRYGLEGPSPVLPRISDMVSSVGGAVQSGLLNSIRAFVKVCCPFVQIPLENKHNR